MSHEDERDREAAPELAAKYDAACRSVTDLHAQLMLKQDHINALAKALQEARSRIPNYFDRKEQKQAQDLIPETDSLLSPSWMVITQVEKRNGMLSVSGRTTLSPTQTVNTRPAPGTPESAQWALSAWGHDEDEDE